MKTILMISATSPDPISGLAEITSWRKSRTLTGRMGSRTKAPWVLIGIRLRIIPRGCCSYWPQLSMVSRIDRATTAEFRGKPCSSCTAAVIYIMLRTIVDLPRLELRLHTVRAMAIGLGANTSPSSNGMTRTDRRRVTEACRPEPP